MSVGLLAAAPAHAQGARGETDGRDEAQEDAGDVPGWTRDDFFEGTRFPEDETQGRERRADAPATQSHARPKQRAPVGARGATDGRRESGVWPWADWNRRQVQPRFAYWQTIDVHVPGRRRYRRPVRVRTEYHYRVRWANSVRAHVDIRIDAIELYEGRRFLGVVDRIPPRLRRIRAVVHRRYGARFDRDLLVIGASDLGFELVATPPQHGYLRPIDLRRGRYEAGRIDLYRGRVVPVYRSRLLRRASYAGLAPVSIVPDDADWLYRTDRWTRPHRRHGWTPGGARGWNRGDDRRGRPGPGWNGPSDSGPPALPRWSAPQSQEAPPSARGEQPRNPSGDEEARADDRDERARERADARRERAEDRRRDRDDRATDRRVRGENPPSRTHWVRSDRDDDRDDDRYGEDPRGEERRAEGQDHRGREADAREVRSSIARRDTVRRTVDGREVQIRRTARVVRLDAGDESEAGDPDRNESEHERDRHR